MVIPATRDEGREQYEYHLMRKLLLKIVAGYDYNPGSSDLDDEQPIHVSMTLGDYRKAMMLLR